MQPREETPIPRWRGLGRPAGARAGSPLLPARAPHQIPRRPRCFLPRSYFGNLHPAVSVVALQVRAPRGARGPPRAGLACAAAGLRPLGFRRPPAGRPSEVWTISGAAPKRRAARGGRARARRAPREAPPSPTHTWPWRRRLLMIENRAFLVTGHMLILWTCGAGQSDQGARHVEAAALAAPAGGAPAARRLGRRARRGRASGAARCSLPAAAVARRSEARLAPGGASKGRGLRGRAGRASRRSP